MLWNETDNGVVSACGRFAVRLRNDNSGTCALVDTLRKPQRFRNMAQAKAAAEARAEESRELRERLQPKK